MNLQSFLRIVDQAYVPFMRALGFSVDTSSSNGRCYCADFKSNTHVISVSYEPGEWVQSVYVFGQGDGAQSEIDGEGAAPRLADLNRRYMASITREERDQNESALASIAAGDTAERDLLKAAKELRLVLPRHISS